jgi:hypothetical protein
MSAERDVNRIVRSWIREEEHDSADRVLEIVISCLDTTPQRRSWWPSRRFSHVSNPVRLAIAAAAVLVVALVGLRFLPSLSNVGQPDPTAGVSPGPTTVAAETPIPLPDGPLAAGTYVMTSGTFRVVFDVPTGRWTKNVVPGVIWTDNSDGRIGFGELGVNLYADPCNWQAGELDPPVGPSVDDFANALAALPGVEATAPVDVTLAGYAGKFVEIQVSGDATGCDDGGRRLAGEGPLENGRHRYWILDVDGDRLIVNAVERTGLAVPYRNQLQQIVDSIRLD